MHCLDDLKIAMRAEAKAWKVLYGRKMNSKYLDLMEKIIEMIEDLSRRLSRPINDLDDVRLAMATLKELRDNEIFIDSSLDPIEVSHLDTSKVTKFKGQTIRSWVSAIFLCRVATGISFFLIL